MAKKEAPEGKRAAGTSSHRRGERKTELLDGGAEIGASEDDTGQAPPVAVMEKLNFGKEELKKMEEKNNSLKVGLQLTQQELEWVKG